MVTKKKKQGTVIVNFSKDFHIAAALKVKYKLGKLSSVQQRVLKKNDIRKATLYLYMCVYSRI